MQNPSAKVQLETPKNVHDRYNSLTSMVSSIHNQASMFEFSKRRSFLEKVNQHWRRVDDIDVVIIKRNCNNTSPPKSTQESLINNDISSDFVELNLSAIEFPENIRESKGVAENFKIWRRRFLKTLSRNTQLRRNRENELFAAKNFSQVLQYLSILFSKFYQKRQKLFSIWLSQFLTGSFKNIIEINVSIYTFRLSW